MELKVPVHVEVILSLDCRLSIDNVSQMVLEKLQGSVPMFKDGFVKVSENEMLYKNVESIEICDLGFGRTVSFWQAELCIHAVRLSDCEPEKDFLEGEDDLPACEQWELPNRMLTGLWESIIADDDIKNRLLGYCDTSMSFSKANVDTNIISWNRMILLYGPPGTGKTTICKALAQKVYFRHSSHYSSGILLEINAHSLFSKWFSESGKLKEHNFFDILYKVMKLFEHVTEIAEDSDCLVCILIDEVESMASARSASVRSNEPSDAIRVVNAVLTSLDSLRRRPNVLILCTSNMIDGIDKAFKDRVDLQLYLGPPPLAARFQILSSCLSELIKRGVISSTDLSTVSSSVVGVGATSSNGLDEELKIVAQLAEGYSGRGLRKLPIKAHAYYLQRPVVSLPDFIRAMRATLECELREKERQSEKIE